MAEYPKSFIRENYENFVVDYAPMFENEVDEIKFLFKPAIKNLKIISVTKDGEIIEGECNGFGLTPYKELLSLAKKFRKETSKFVNIKFIMEI